MGDIRGLLKARWVDDGMYCVGWWIEEADGTCFAETSSEEAAKEIVSAVNVIRNIANRLADVASRFDHGDSGDPPAQTKAGF